jgi:hypothetical protein
MASFRSLAAGLLLGHSVVSPAMADEVRTVEVNGMRNPELKPYRVMLAGVDAFDDYHALAPTAPEVRFRLRLNSGAKEGAKEGAVPDNLTLRIAGNQSSVVVPLTADGQFSLPRIAALLDDDADLVLNQRKGNYRWDAEVRSEGLPSNVRRLGDLRLECEVSIAVAKKEMSLWMHATITSLLLTNHWCGSRYLNYWIEHSPRPLRLATLVTGQQRVALKLGDDGRSFIGPAGDESYPDETLIELDYADADAAQEPF